MLENKDKIMSTSLVLDNPAHTPAETNTACKAETAQAVNPCVKTSGCPRLTQAGALFTELPNKLLSSFVPQFHDVYKKIHYGAT